VTNLGKIISGGQTGVDQAAFRAARESGLMIGGWCPPGRICESGTIPPEFELEETPRERSSEALEIPRSLRTEWNVRDSEATLILQPRDYEDLGTTWAIRCANTYGRPFFECDPGDQDAASKIREWLRGLDVRILHVGGPSEGNVSGIGALASRVLLEVFTAPR